MFKQKFFPSSSSKNKSKKEPNSTDEVDSSSENEAFQLLWPGLDKGALIPSDYSCYNEDGSKKDARDEPIPPEFTITGIPKSCKSLAFFVIDYDVKGTKSYFCHYARFNISPTTQRLTGSSGLKAENDGQTLGFYGICPPRGEKHVYFFRLLALTEKLELKSGATWLEVQEKINKNPQILIQESYLSHSFTGPIEEPQPVLSTDLKMRPS